MSKKIIIPILLMVLIQFGCKPIDNTKGTNEPPEWAKHAIWYQIFVERFNNGDPNNDPKPENMRCDTSYIVPKDWKLSAWTDNWYETTEWEKNLMATKKANFDNILQLRRFGGDLQGVINKLDYLNELGINAIYLNPINDSPSLHKYDARSYHHVDVNFGPDPEGDNKLIASENPVDTTTWKWTSADKLFLKLIDLAHQKGMRIIMDYSWNHTGTEFWAWKDILKNQEKSPYRNWYEIKSFDNPSKGTKFAYSGWAGVMSMPEIKKVNLITERVSGHPYEGDINAGAKRYIFDVSKRWLAPNGDKSKGVDGYRLDVADQIPMGFWRDYRTFVKGVKADAYLVGEIWWETWPDRLMNPVPYTSGDVFDAVMHYQLYKPAKYFFSVSKFGLDAKQFKDSLEFQWNRLKEPFRYGMMNVNATHDSPRLLTCFNNPGKYKYNSRPSEDSSYKAWCPDAETYRRVKLYLIHQFTNIGAPQIWNGDEMGMWGDDDPNCRKPLWWKELSFKQEIYTDAKRRKTISNPVTFNQEHFDFYKKIIHIRKDNPVLSTGSLDFLQTEGKLLVYKREDGKSQIIVAFNLDQQKKEINLPEAGNYTNLLDNSKISGKSIALNPMDAVILKKD